MSERLGELLARIDRQRDAIDRTLSRPARWRGPIRRELTRGPAPKERAAVAAAFDRLAASAPGGPPLGTRELLRVHAEVGGGDGFRVGGVRVGPSSWPPLPPPSAHEVPALVTRALERAFDGLEPPALAAARLHLELLLIHPFPDANGRTARLAASYVLMRAGFRSTLLTAVEQHFHANPHAYGRAFYELRAAGAADQEPWLAAALSAMAGHSALATWHRRSGRSFEGLEAWRRSHPRDAAEMAYQVERLDEEEAEDHALPPPRRGRDRGERASSRPAPVGSEGRVAATVVVPAYRAAETVVRCLEGLRRQDLAEPFDIVVVASGDDATADIVRRSFPEVRLLRSDQRLSPGAARNAGIASARGDVVAFLAADCVPEPDWLRRRLAAHRAGHRLVAGYVDSEARPGLVGWTQYVAKYRGMLAPRRDARLGRGPLFHLSYDRTLLVEAGPFREDVLAGEDTELNHALVSRGERVWFDPEIRIRHVNERSWRAVLEGQRRQGASAGALCRGGALDPYFRHLLRRSPLSATIAAVAVLAEVARVRPRALPRTIVTLPLIVWSIRARRASFRRAHSGDLAPPIVGGGPVAAVAPAPRDPRVSVVIAAFDEEKLIGRCIDSVLAQSLGALEVIVVDDGSRDRTAEVARRRGVRVVTVPHRGPARARNTGAALARGEVLVFVDADLELDPGCIERLTAPILDGRSVGTFTKDMWVANPERPWATCWTLNRGFPVGHVFPPGFPDTWSNHRAVRRDAFLRVGGYDDVGYGEDMVLAGKLGTPAVAVDGARMWHHNPDTLGEIWRNAVWVGRGVRIRELDRIWRRYAPWRSLARGVRVARSSGRTRFVPFKLVYDTGVLLGYAASHLAPSRHWK